MGLLNQILRTRTDSIKSPDAIQPQNGLSQSRNNGCVAPSIPTGGCAELVVASGGAGSLGGRLVRREDGLLLPLGSRPGRGPCVLCAMTR